MMKQIFAYFFFAAGSYGLEYLFVFFQVDFFVHIILLVIVHDLPDGVCLRPAAERGSRTHDDNTA